mmetsp:Transcript_4531/g.13054  ORF Transcript_4531/g.13054 Transcript_4531/m.13054 type:complete len:224 (-) Transcript_4531:264-935(-)
MTELDQERTKEYFVKSECLKQRYRSGFVRTRDPSIHPIQRSTLGATRLYTALHYTTLQTMHTPHPTTPLTPSLSASASRMGKLSPLLIPLPPLTTMLALDRSGRSDFETDSPIHSALSKCSTTPSRVSTSTDEASTRSALSKQVGRTDRTLRLDPPGPGLATTLPSTLPAYIGRIKVSFVPYQNDDCGGCGGGDGSGSGSGYIMCCVANTGKARQQQKRQFLT